MGMDVLAAGVVVVVSVAMVGLYKAKDLRIFSSVHVLHVPSRTFVHSKLSKYSVPLACLDGSRSERYLPFAPDTSRHTEQPGGCWRKEQVLGRPPAFTSD